MDFKSFEGVVAGRVQGVGFRYFARETAIELDLTGWVRNLPDGTVEFHAEGPIEKMEEFLRRIKRGPLSGRVDRLTGDWTPCSHCLSFDIKP